ncbi:hypothetical protein HNQ80_001155 [Anaerosolibacter carboniphilus]|uniref:SEFIR domain-containing protein n=1 Tax=Anaerosolibacter carboniphilus TaxID=1417629 RepID=A0A841KNQ6_9FIRM|nr:toll/interleukin-1 receptor domain-containing protein [Anaerosolibacter carboniphilus]MBB6215066.1 hypothetical protein [Anaerosolibacter carboniphilus]
MDKNPTTFISYSWDSDEHRGWVASLVNLLRENGVDATADVFETQKGTVNLNTMMVKNIKDNDYTIVVLTEKYAEKADELQGGVGFETSMLLSYIHENMQKIIPIMKCKENKSKAIPFYLKGAHFIDFSERHDFKEKFNELLHRIYKVDLVERSPLGKRPDLKPRKSIDVSLSVSDDFEDIIPNFKKITDADKNRFMKDSFIQLRDGFIQLLENTRGKNSDFDFDCDNITSRKTIFKLYLHGDQKYAIKIWLGNNFGRGSETINFAYGNHISDSDNSMNEIVTCEVDKDNTLKLRMTMNMFGDAEANTPVAVLREVWRNVLQWIK